MNELSTQFGRSLLVCEPNLSSHSEFELVDLEFLVDNADIVLVLVDHKPFKKLTAEYLSEKAVIDTRHIVR